MIDWLLRLAGLRHPASPAGMSAVLNDALDIALDWGNWLSPIQDRLLLMHRQLTATQLGEINDLCHAAVRASLAIALRLSRECEMSALKNRFDAELLEQYPWISNENRERIYRHAIYHATKTSSSSNHARFHS